METRGVYIAVVFRQHGSLNTVQTWQCRVCLLNNVTWHTSQREVPTARRGDTPPPGKIQWISLLMEEYRGKQFCTPTRKKKLTTREGAITMRKTRARGGWKEGRAGPCTVL
jgi:hypothetical protein